MLKAMKHIKITGHVVLMWFVFFALAPCIVKEALFSATLVEYSKPLNKTKTTTPTSFCQYVQAESQRTSVFATSKKTKKIDVLRTGPAKIRVVHHNGIVGHYSKVFSGNSPPKYILYKRLKISIA